MILDVILLIIGLVLLVYGANWLVDGASSVAAKLGVSAMVVGLTVVAFGTSMPELVVNIMSSVKGSSGLAIGNVVGSNTINILIVLGVSALIRPIAVKRSTIRVEIPYSLFAAAMLFLLANDVLIDGASESVLSRIDGIVLLSFLGLFFYYTYFSSKSEKNPHIPDVKVRKTWLSILLILAGIVGLYFGGQLIVDSAIQIAQSLGIPDSIIGLTVVALGTSLPELVTSAVAACKGNIDIAVGNVLGSNIFNIFMVLGVSSLIRPLPFYPQANIDILMTAFASLLLFIVVLLGRGQRIDRKGGAFFVAIYLSYLVYIIVNYK
ncbi:MAG: calcium/sodium antiporter [Bacteroidales bacterium]|nr:calcium/sodium antiporter [Bacteroidales bacterium]MDD4672070.1 calcium/sodium antiporter [Bacteroidales bacterium]MDY0347589.1 calcium/sodium antiporter [Tenuifilaceae bacterium]